MYASDEDIAFFQEMGWNYRSLDKEFAIIHQHRMAEDAAAAKFVYHDSIMLERVLKDMEAYYPQFVKLKSIGNFQTAFFFA